MADTSSLRKGAALRLTGKLYFVQSTFFVSPGKGSAFYRTKLKEITTGKYVEKTFKSGEKVDFIETERQKATFLYKKQATTYVFLTTDTYDQHELELSVIGAETATFLKKEAEVMLLIIDEEVVAVDLMKTKIAFKVTHAPPAIKGDTVSSTYRPVTIETGATVLAPMFIQTGDVIIINTETGEYSERQRS